MTRKPTPTWNRMAGVLTAALLLATTVIAQDKPVENKPVDVLVMSGGQLKVDPQLQEQFARENIHFVTRKISEPISAEMLRKFHVVMITDWEGPSSVFARGLITASLTAKRNTELLQDYIKTGGGFFFTPVFGSQGAAESLTGFLTPFGAGVQSAQVRDDAHAWSNLKPEKPEDYYDYSWTTDITAHPATRGVKRLFYPTSELRWDDLYSTPVLKLQDPAWISLVKGMKTSVAAKGVDYYNWHTVGNTPPVLAAARNFGEGRIALFTPNFYFTLANPFGTPARGWILEAHTGKIDGVLLDKGDGVHPSNGRLLLTGMLRWLADGARAKGMGGYEEKAFAQLQPPTPVADPDWLFSWKPDGKTQWFKLLVGARSSFSDGKGSIEEYAKAAKTAGVSMLFMTESFASFDPAKWQKYREACAKASDATLKVVPGLDIPDAFGNRYLLLGSPNFPAPNLLTPDGKALIKPQYLCICFPKAITVLHRATTTAVPHQLHKFFQGLSLFTYRNGVLEDNSLPAYEWQVFRFSNPMPFAVHETFSPEDLAKEASTGHQCYGSSDNLADLSWYLGEHGLSHFWESPLHLQVSAGPMITALGGSIPDPGEPSVSGAAGFSIQSDEPIKEVTMWENFNLYRRWTPNTKEFTVKSVKLPVGHANWFYLIATDAKGRTVVSPGMLFGKQIVHTWRCGDRQNWWDFSNIYTGCEMSQVEFRVPSNGTLEGSGLFPEPHGPQRGDNLAPILDFSLASPAAYIQDLYLDQRYYRAVMDEVMCDAKPVNPTSRSRVFEAKVRYQRFYVEKPEGKVDFMPERKEVVISLRKPIESDADVFPVFSHLDIKHAQVSGDMSYSYVDPSTHVEVTGTLQKGFLDLPRGGRVGGFIALSDGIRVGANHIVGFAPPAWTNGALPIGTSWHAAFVTVPPAEVGNWLSLMGLRGQTPYSLSVKSGKLADIAYVADCDSANFGFEGSVDKPMDASLLQPLVTGLVNNDKEALGKPLREYRLPMTVAGVNYNWPAALLRDGKFVEEVPVFEGKAYARLDVTKAGSFYIGNTVLCDAPKLRIGLLRWTADGCEVELNNPTRADIEATVWTVPQVKDQFNGRATVKVKAGSSLNAKLGAGIPPQ